MTIELLYVEHENSDVCDKVNELVDAVNRLEQALGTLADWLVQAQTGFGARDSQGIHDILAGRER